MRNVSPDSVEPQRPYRIFISLLDKWEIGYSLTNALILDALKALKAASETSGLGSEVNTHIWLVIFLRETDGWLTLFFKVFDDWIDAL